MGCGVAVGATVGSVVMVGTDVAMGVAAGAQAARNMAASTIRLVNFQYDFMVVNLLYRAEILYNVYVQCHYKRFVASLSIKFIECIMFCMKLIFTKDLAAQSSILFTEAYFLP